MTDQKPTWVKSTSRTGSIAHIPHPEREGHMLCRDLGKGLVGDWVEVADDDPVRRCHICIGRWVRRSTRS